MKDFDSPVLRHLRIMNTCKTTSTAVAAQNDLTRMSLPCTRGRKDNRKNAAVNRPGTSSRCLDVTTWDCSWAGEAPAGAVFLLRPCEPGFPVADSMNFALDCGGLRGLDNKPAHFPIQFNSI